jgi:hypothetical protein
MADWSWLTGGSSGSTLGGISDPNLGPTGWSSSGQATWNPTDTTGSVSSGDVSKALSSLSKGLGSSSGSSSSGSSSNPQLSSSSGAVAGKGGGLDTLIQLLAQRRNAYMQAATGAGGGSGKSGLLGV